MRLPRQAALLLLGGPALLACGADPVSSGASDETVCSIPTSQIHNGGPGKDGIPALSDPTLARPGEAGAAYLRDDDRVIGIDLDGDQLAVPLNILWWHEIVNVRVGSRRVAVTHCPLTGSSLVFDREPLGGREFGVSGLLYLNNLIMYDRTASESLWSQMVRGPVCGTAVDRLTMLPAVEMTWSAWRQLYPNAPVVSSETGYRRNYQVSGYGDYGDRDNPSLLFPLPGGIDTRRPPKERVLGIAQGLQGGIAFPFGTLADGGQVAAVETATLGRPLVILWDGAAQAAMAFEALLEDGTRLNFRVEGGRVVDEQSGSSWRFDGVAIDGPRAGQRLTPVADAYVAYWFAWAAFHPATRLWNAP